MPRKDTTPREGRAGTAFNAKYVAAMERIEDMSVRRALGQRLAFRCPVCGWIHPGIKYQNAQHLREYCSTPCYTRRREAQ